MINEKTHYWFVFTTAWTDLILHAYEPISFKIKVYGLNMFHFEFENSGSAL